MTALIITFIVLGLLLAAEELAWKKKILPGEYQRKFGHIGLGVFAATWPWFLSWNQIKFLGAGALAFTLINHYTKLFKYLGAVKRGGYGDIFYAAAILVCSLLTDRNIFFALAMLNIALADGLAAIVGKNFKPNRRFKILGQTKSLAGSLTFWLISLLILAAGLLPAYSPIGSPKNIFLIILLPPLLTTLEGLSIYGIDNLVVPAAVVLALRLAG